LIVFAGEARDAGALLGFGAWPVGTAAHEKRNAEQGR
jgi:hypothetical protein